MLPLRFTASILLFNEAEALSPLHAFKSSGSRLSSKGITKLIIEEKIWCIPVVHVSSSHKCSLSEQHRKHMQYIIHTFYMWLQPKEDVVKDGFSTQCFITDFLHLLSVVITQLMLIIFIARIHTSGRVLLYSCESQVYASVSNMRADSLLAVITQEKTVCFEA